MFVPITSQVNIEKGIVLREISSGKLFEVSRRIVSNPEVYGEPVWEINSLEGNDHEQKVLRYLILAEKYLAEVDD